MKHLAAAALAWIPARILGAFAVYAAILAAAAFLLVRARKLLGRPWMALWGGVALVGAVLRLLPAGPALSSDIGATAPDRAAMLAIVRGAIGAAPPSATADSAFLRRRARVFVSEFDHGRERRRGISGRPLGDALASCGRELRDDLGRAPPPDAWIRVDVLAGEAPLSDANAPGELEGSFEPGIDGVRAESSAGAEGVVLPEDGITGGWWSGNEIRVGAARFPTTRGAIALHAITMAKTRLSGGSAGAGPAARLVRFRTDAFLARAGAGEPIPLFRGVPDVPARPSPEALRAAALASGDWLAANVDPSGRFARYAWLPVTDASDATDPYNVIRHIAAAWVLERFAARFGRPAWKEAGERALAWVEPEILPSGRAIQGIPQYVLAAPGATRGGLGETATAVLALAAKGSLAADEDAKLLGLAATLEWMVRPDGRFYESELEAASGTVKPHDHLLYEPGEALLALTTMAERRPLERHWLEAAQRAARYQERCFEDGWLGADCYGDEEHASVLDPGARIPALSKLRSVDRAHWLAQAFAKLAVLDGNRRWAFVSLDMADAILMTADPPNQINLTPDHALAGASPRDVLGAYPIDGAPPFLTPSASRAEALNAARVAALLVGRDPRPYESMLILSAGFQVRNQYTEASCYFCPAPEHVRGAFRRSLLDGQTRVDYVQHGLSGMAATLDWYGAPDASTSSSSRPSDR